MGDFVSMTRVCPRVGAAPSTVPLDTGKLLLASYWRVTSKFRKPCKMKTFEISKGYSSTQSLTNSRVRYPEECYAKCASGVALSRTISVKKAN